MSRNCFFQTAGFSSSSSRRRPSNPRHPKLIQQRQEVCSLWKKKKNKHSSSPFDVGSTSPPRPPSPISFEFPFRRIPSTRPNSRMYSSLRFVNLTLFLFVINRLLIVFPVALVCMARDCRGVNPSPSPLRHLSPSESKSSFITLHHNSGARAGRPLRKGNPTKTVHSRESITGSAWIMEALSIFSLWIDEGIFIILFLRLWEVFLWKVHFGIFEDSTG